MRIKEIIQERGLRSKDLAAKMGIRSSSFSDMINRDSITLKSMRGLSEAIGCETVDFFRDEMSDEWLLEELRRRGLTDGGSGLRPAGVPAAQGLRATGRTETAGQAPQTAPQAGGVNELPFSWDSDDEKASRGGITAQAGGPSVSAAQAGGTALRQAIVCPHCGAAIGITVSDGNLSPVSG